MGSLAPRQLQHLVCWNDERDSDAGFAMAIQYAQHYCLWGQPQFKLCKQFNTAITPAVPAHSLCRPVGLVSLRDKLQPASCNEGQFNNSGLEL